MKSCNYKIRQAMLRLLDTQDNYSALHNIEVIRKQTLPKLHPPDLNSKALGIKAKLARGGG